MELPSRLKDLIGKDQALNALVLKTLTTVKPWTLDNKTVFFHEYTDHSLKHLAEVLLTAEGLISDESWPQLTSEDGAIIILSVLLHDCALHLSEDGFFSLIQGSYNPGLSRYINNDVPWPTLWNLFINEARRFDQRKLTSLFGSCEPIQDIPTNKLDLTFKHRLLIGEFLRRHHARLAHEIAISGIPGHGNTLKLGDSEFKELMDLAGFVARSHNLSLRSAVDMLEPNQRRVHRNCRVPFVMMVLRIADYLQIHSSRAPGQLLRLKSLVSPVSRGEWKKHMSVREINQAHDDREAIFIDCEPESASTFLAMQSLLRDIQVELDNSWAVLGEAYGRISPLDCLGITIRRIRSNLDDPKLYWEQRRPPYLPRDFRFKTASAELMDLLVMPLYGKRPEVGIRELIQNSVDACRERDDLASRGLITKVNEISNDVIVSLTILNDEPATLVIEDYGVGMTADVVDKYLLNIGASFRRSDAWRQNHETGGHSTVHRTGRFGIGLLAAFLLGPEIKVTTRSIHDAEDSAITFNCQQGSESIEVIPCSFHAGTRIEIQLDKETAEKLSNDKESWDWYCLTSPNVQRMIINESKTILKQNYSVPDCDSDLESTKWRRIFTEGYDDVIWSYESPERENKQTSLVICNGIWITSHSYKITPKISSELGVIAGKTPSMVVYDADGRFPLNLQRSDLADGSTGFEKELALDISRYIVGRIIEKFEGLNPGITSENIIMSANPQILGLTSGYPYRTNLAPMILTKTGVIPVDADILRSAKISHIVIDAVSISTMRGAFNSQTLAAWTDYYLAMDGVSQTKTSRVSFLRDSIGESNFYPQLNGFLGPLNPIGRRLLVRKKDISELVTPGNVPRSKWSKLTLEIDLGPWGLWSAGIVPELTLDIFTVCEELDKSSAFGFTVLYFDSELDNDEPLKSQTSAFAEIWNQSVRTPLLEQRPR